MKRIIKLAQNKKDINRLTNINICIFEIELSNGCAFKISSVRGPLGYWNYRLYHLHTTGGSSFPASIVPHQQLLFLLTTKRSWRSISRKRKTSNNLQAINPIRGLQKLLRFAHESLLPHDRMTYHAVYLTLDLQCMALPLRGRGSKVLYGRTLPSGQIPYLFFLKRKARLGDRAHSRTKLS